MSVAFWRMYWLTLGFGFVWLTCAIRFQSSRSAVLMRSSARSTLVMRHQRLDLHCGQHSFSSHSLLST